MNRTGNIPRMPDHEYCAAIPPRPIRQTANCLRTLGHEGEHSNHAGDHWVADSGNRPTDKEP